MLYEKWQQKGLDAGRAEKDITGLCQGGYEKFWSVPGAWKLSGKFTLMCKIAVKLDSVSACDPQRDIIGQL